MSGSPSSPNSSPVPTAAVRARLPARFESMGSARPDLLPFARVPLSGRSRKPDRFAAAELVTAGKPEALSRPKANESTRP